MQSTWYLFPGQTVENTKIQDRGKALVATPAGWKKITGHLDRNKVQEELAEQDRARRQYLKEGSYEMTKNWDNSIEKIRQRRLEEHEKKAKEREEDLFRRFIQLRKEQEDERNKLVAEAKKRLYMHQEKSRNLNSALLLSEVLYERKLQQEFDKHQGDHEKIEDAKYAQLVRYNAEQEKRENKEKQQKKKELDLKYSVELKEQIKQIEDEEKREREERMKEEKIDNIRAKEEMDAIKKYERKQDLAKKADVKKQFHEFEILQKQYKAEKKKQNDDEDKIIKIYGRAKCRIDNKKQIREKEVQAEKIRIRERIASKVMAQVASNEEAEKQIIINAQKEREERELERLERDEAYQKKLREEREDYRKKCIQRKKEIEAENKEIEKWELLNRLKTNEVIQKYEQDKNQKLFDEKIEYRKELLDQMADMERGKNYEKKCNAEELKYYKDKLAKEDKEFFTYADEVLELAKSRGRTTEPIAKIVQQYKIDNQLEPKKKNLTALQSKVPINNN